MVDTEVPEERLQGLAALLARELGENLPVDPAVAADAARAIVTAAVAAAEHRADLATLISGDAQSALIHVAEHIAGPYDVSVDFNWPGSRLARSAPEIPVGSTFLAGDGEGNRAVVEIVEVSGERSGRLDPTTWANPADRYLREASASVARVLAR